MFIKILLLKAKNLSRLNKILKNVSRVYTRFWNPGVEGLFENQGDQEGQTCPQVEVPEYKSFYYGLLAGGKFARWSDSKSSFFKRNFRFGEKEHHKNRITWRT